MLNYWIGVMNVDIFFGHFMSIWGFHHISAILEPKEQITHKHKVVSIFIYFSGLNMSLMKGNEIKMTLLSVV